MHSNDSISIELQVAAARQIAADLRKLMPEKASRWQGRFGENEVGISLTDFIDACDDLFGDTGNAKARSYFREYVPALLALATEWVTEGDESQIAEEVRRRIAMLALGEP